MGLLSKVDEGLQEKKSDIHEVLCLFLYFNK